MHCTTSGAPGSLLPHTVLGSPLSHRSECCPPGRALHFPLPRLLVRGVRDRAGLLSDVRGHSDACQDCYGFCVYGSDFQAYANPNYSGRKYFIL